MKEQEVDHLIEEFYSNVSLSDSKLKHILDNTPSRDNVVPFYRKGWFSYSAAACIAFMIVSVVVTGALNKGQAGTQIALANQIVQINDHYNKPDVYSEDLRTIQRDLGHKDFSIIPTSFAPIKQYKILGGRNCAFEGVKAVHVVLVNEYSQKKCCLYILPDIGSLKRFKESLVNVDNHKVSFWHDEGRIFALYDPS